MSEDKQKIALEIIEAARKIIGTERGAQHGDLVGSFTMIAEQWSVWINHSIARATGIPPIPSIHLSPFDVLQMMGLLKSARSVYGDSALLDHYIDDIGYTALAGALAAQFVSTSSGPDAGPSDPGSIRDAGPELELDIPAFLRDKAASE